MNESISYSETFKQYDSEWVLLGDPKTKPGPVLLSGKVLWHSKDRDEVYRKAIELKPKHSAILYTGKMPKGTAIIL